MKHLSTVFVIAAAAVTAMRGKGRTMNRNVMRGPVWLAVGMAVCLTASSCRTFHDTQPVTEWAPALSLSDESKSWRSPTLQKMKDIIIPEVSFRPHATIVDAIDFFRRASVEYDDPEIPLGQRGLGFALRLPHTYNEGDDEDSDCEEDDEDSDKKPAVTDRGFFSVDKEDGKGSGKKPVETPVIPALHARNISLYDALRLVCEVTGMHIIIYGNVVRVIPFAEKDFLCSYPRRSYFIDFATAERFFPMTTEDEWKSFFADLGVSWPGGSSLTIRRLFGRLHVKNTEENLEAVDAVLEELNSFYPYSFHLEVEVVAFKEDDIAKLQSNGGVTKEALMGLRKAGKSKPVTVASGMTNPEQEVMVKAVREVTYPSEPVSCEYAMREVGMILQAVLHDTLPLNPLVDVTLRPQWVTLERWESHSMDVLTEGKRTTLHFRQPVFGVTSFETKVTLKDGSTVLLGTVPVPDGKWVHAGFLTVRRVDAREGSNP